MQQEAFYSQVKRLDGVFVPGGDPGNNHAAVLLPFLEKMAALLARHHPHAKIWLSLQHHLNTPEDAKLVYDYLETKSHLVWRARHGARQPRYGIDPPPSSKAVPVALVPGHYTLCSLSVSRPLDGPGNRLTLGREPVNPRPVDYTDIYRPITVH